MEWPIIVAGFAVVVAFVDVVVVAFILIDIHDELEEESDVK